MHLQHRIREGVATLFAAGVVNAQDVVEGVQDLMADPKLMLKPLVLCDFLEVTLLNVTTPELHKLCEAMGGRDSELFGARIAFVSDQAHVFGIARMLEALVEDLPIEMRVFRELAEAETWLATRR